MSARTPTTAAPRPTAAPRRGVAGRVVRALVSMIGLLVMLAGLPAALTVVAGWPLPDTWPTGQQWLAWLERPVTVPFLVGLFACAGWLLWVGLLFAVAAEVLSVVARVDTSRWRLPAPLRAVAAGLVGAVVLALTGTAARAATTPAPAGAAAVTGPAAPTTAGTAAVMQAVPPASAATTTKAHHGKVTFEIRGQRYHALVRRGDTMSKIARQWLGDADRWPEICRLNWHRHWPKTGGKLRDCDLIYPRWDLRLPADATPPPGAIRIGTPPPKPPQLPAPPPPAPQPAITPPADPDGVIEPDTTTTAPPATGNQTAPRPDTDTSPQTGPHEGVTLPGGWMSTALAAAILAAVAGAWAMRRHRYRPRRPTSLQHPDPWWPPLPHIVRRLRAALRNDDRPELDPDNDATRVGQTATETDRDSAQTDDDRLQGGPRDIRPDQQDRAPASSIDAHATATGTHLAGLGTLPPQGVVLAGPGAHAAARALIVAAATAAPKTPGHLITTHSTAMALLGDTPQHPRTTVAATTADAIEHVTRLILARTRQTHDLDEPPTPPATVLLLDSSEGHDKVLDALL
ncbi:hypothetical protein AB0B66_42600, partial [Catellatospora sp. NPDC049111]